MVVEASDVGSCGGRLGASARQVEMTAWAAEDEAGRSASETQSATGRGSKAENGGNVAQRAEQTRGGEQGRKHACGGRGRCCVRN